MIGMSTFGDDLIQEMTEAHAKGEGPAVVHAPIGVVCGRV